MRLSSSADDAGDHIGLWCNGSIAVSKTADPGSNPGRSSRAKALIQPLGAGNPRNRYEGKQLAAGKTAGTRGGTASGSAGWVPQMQACIGYYLLAHGRRRRQGEGDKRKRIVIVIRQWQREGSGKGANAFPEEERNGGTGMGWEYEGLFDAVDPEAEDLTGSLWRSTPTAIRVGTMGYRTRTIRAGKRLEVEVYPIFGREQERRARAAKANMTGEAQRRLNLERSKRRFIRLADANFDEHDIHLTLTYKDAPGYERARKDLRNFLLRVKRLREKRGLPELKYAGTIEGNDDGTRERIHVHLLMSGGVEREELEKIWAKGYANADRLKPDGHGLEAIARYITKQQRNRRKWFTSRNLKQPKERVSDTKMSNARIKRIAADFCGEARGIMEKLYKGYGFTEAKIYHSDIVDGVYIRVIMRRRQ